MMLTQKQIKDRQKHKKLIPLICSLIAICLTPLVMVYLINNVPTEQVRDWSIELEQANEIIAAKDPMKQLMRDLERYYEQQHEGAIKARVEELYIEEVAQKRYQGR
jgi:hypothetical protein